MRGEYDALVWARVGETELPPRARRIPVSGRNFFPLSGTTSACAENTFTREIDAHGLWNYLRVRGEYTVLLTPTPLHRELPPRARRILVCVLFRC